MLRTWTRQVGCARPCIVIKFLSFVWLIALFTTAVASSADEVPALQASEQADAYLPGVALTQGITEITGVAISPLLGVSSVGAWQYWKAPAELRSSLPWYAQPWAWGTGMGILALCFLKDSLGAAVPGVLKKPFDMVELFENKASGLVASAAFVPLVANQMAVHFRAEHGAEIEVPTASLIGLSLGGFDVAWLIVPGSVIAFLMVWLCSHAINVLIILSPFSTVDSLLKILRTALLASIGLIYVFTPWLAAVFCLGIIAIAAWLTPSALRLAIFGARFAGDILVPGVGRNGVTPESPHAFTLGKLADLPPRTGGRIVRLDDGSVVFRYRRACFLDERTIPLPNGWRHVEKGLLSPSLIHRDEDQEHFVKLLLFLPRYRGHEEGMVEHLEFHGVRDHAISRGFSAVRGWLSEMLRRKRKLIG